jgi:hypothetical protein
VKRVAVAAALLAACTGATAVDAGAGIDGGQADAPLASARKLVATLPAQPLSGPPALDLLFVIDNSSSMGQKQDALVAAFPRLTAALGQLKGGLPDLHLGVISTDASVAPYSLDSCFGDGDDGLLQNRARGSCTAPTAARYLEDLGSASGRTRNYNGTLDDAFTCIARLGDQGCGFEQPYASLERALGGQKTENAGFLRPGSFLAVIVFSDEDDCSAKDHALFNPDPAQNNVHSALGALSSYRCTEFGVVCDGAVLPRATGAYGSCTARADSPYLFTPAHTADFLRSLRDPTRLFVGALTGDPAPFAVAIDPRGNPVLQAACNQNGRSADPGVRHRDLLAAFPTHAAFSSICGDLGPALDAFGKELATLVSGTCLSGPIGGAAAGQADCKVYSAGAGARAELPACGAPPCYTMSKRADACPFSPGNLALGVMWGGAPPTGARVEVECAP